MAHNSVRSVVDYDESRSVTEYGRLGRSSLWSDIDSMVFASSCLARDEARLYDVEYCLHCEHGHIFVVRLFRECTETLIVTTKSASCAIRNAGPGQIA